MTCPKSIKISLTILFSLFPAMLIVGGLFALTGNNGPDTGKNHALIIGIGTYDKWPKLKSPTKDAEGIAKILVEKYNFKKKNIVLLGCAGN